MEISNSSDDKESNARRLKVRMKALIDPLRTRKRKRNLLTNPPPNSSTKKDKKREKKKRSRSRRRKQSPVGDRKGCKAC